MLTSNLIEAILFTQSLNIEHLVKMSPHFSLHRIIQQLTETALQNVGRNRNYVQFI